MGRRRQDILIGCSLLLVCTVAFLIYRFDLFSGLREAMQTRTVSTGVLNYGPMGKILKQLNLLKFEENDYTRFKQTKSVDEDIEVITFQKKRQVDENLYTVNPSGKLTYRSTVIARSLKQKPGWPIVSIAIDEKSLHDQEIGILANRDKSGREWERVAEVSYMEDGEILFETYAGLRVHGGKRLITEKYAHGYKVYFRNKYGLPAVPDGLIFADSPVPIRTLVLQTTTWPPGYPMNNPLAYDIVRQIDCVVPPTRLVEIYVNGKSLGMGYAVEHLSRRQWGQRYGHDDYNFYKFRSDISPEDKKMYIDQFWGLVTEREKLSRARVAERIDLDNFSRHVFSWVFNGTTDYCQGVAVYDKTETDARIRWINWDMDHSFYDHIATQYKRKRQNWQQPAFRLVYKERHNCGRTKLFTRLMKESPEYKRELVLLVNELLNHRLSQEFLSSRVTYYKQMMASYGQPHTEYVHMLEEFIRHRSDFVFGDMEGRFELEGPYDCQVLVPAGIEILVDGYRYSNDYAGKYFGGVPVRIELPPDAAKRFDYWLVNGKRVDSNDLHLELNEDTQISVSLRPDPAG